IPVNEEKYKEAGTYNVDYKVVDQWGNEGTASVTIKVHGLPIINATGQEYTLEENDVITGVINNPIVSWKQASDTLNQVATDITIPGPANTIGGNNTIKYEVVSGPSDDFSKIGVYKVKYTATNPDGKISEKTVPVTIEPKGTITEPTHSLFIYANSFTIEQTEAINLTDEIVKDSTHGNAFAYKLDKDEEGVTIDATDLTNQVTVNTEQLNKIKNAPTTGGIYELTFDIQNGNLSVSKVITVVVKGEKTPPPVITPDGNELSITANDFSLSYQEAKSLDETNAINKAEVKVVLLNQEETKTRTMLLTKVDTTQLYTINQADVNGGIYSLTFTGVYIDTDGNETTISTTVQVEVYGSDEVEAPGTTGANTIATNDTSKTLWGYVAMIFITGSYIYLRKKKSEE
ncbi:MAG: hypothetical protein ACK5LC_08940, partial [Coprobacillaceae bacterium]